MSTLNKQLQERIGGLIGKDYKCYDCNIEDCDHELYNQPNLQDLLIAFNKNEVEYLLCNDNIQIFEKDFDGLVYKYNIWLDLSLSIFSHSDETKQKLLDLIK